MIAADWHFFAVFDSFLSCKWFENLLEPIFYLRAITKKNFQLKIPILRKIDCSAIYAHAMMGLIFIWDLLVMCPGAKNRFRLSGGIHWQISLIQVSSECTNGQFNKSVRYSYGTFAGWSSMVWRYPNCIVWNPTK